MEAPIGLGAEALVRKSVRGKARTRRCGIEVGTKAQKSPPQAPFDRTGNLLAGNLAAIIPVAACRPSWREGRAFAERQSLKDALVLGAFVKLPPR
jgi:hypothetical protein